MQRWRDRSKESYTPIALSLVRFLIAVILVGTHSNTEGTICSS